MNIIWLRPYTGENVSVRRERISEHLEEIGVSVTIIDVTGIKSLFAVYEVITGDYDVIVGNVRMGLYLGYLIAVVLRKPFLGDVTDPLSQIESLPRPFFYLLKQIEWFILKKANKSVFVTNSSYKEAIERGITDPVQLPNAVDYKQFANPSRDTISQTDNILRENEINPDDKIAIYHGSMVARYHLTEIGEAAEKLPDWEFVFIGKERGAGIEKIAADRSNVHFLGSFDYEFIPGFLSHSNLGLCLIDSEGPLKLKEFFAAGLPTLVIPKMSEWQDFKNLIYTAPNPDAIISAIRDFDTSPDIGQEFNTDNSEVETWKDISQKYYQIFNEICEEDY